MKANNMLVASAVAGLLMACGTTPNRIDELEQARTSVQRVEASPLAGKYAAAEVTAAHAALREADRLADARKSGKQVREAAYLAQRHADIAEQQIARGQAEEATASAEAERERVRLQAREQEAAARQREADAARAQAQQVAEAARREAAMLEQQLRDLEARQTDRGMVLTLGDVLFDTGQATLKPGANNTVGRLADFLRQAPERSVTIEGHTDSVGSDSLNQALSESRANAVKAALVAQGVDPARVVAVGKGKHVPVAGNETAAGRQQNRRVEIIVSNPPVGLAARP